MTPGGLKRIRKGLNLTQEALAKHLGVTQNAVARWEIGARRITEPMARLIRLVHAQARGKARKKK